MQGVFNVNGGYTEEATILDREIRARLKDIIRRELENGSSVEAIEHVIFHAISKEVMLQNIFKRNERNVKGEKIDNFK